MSERPLIPTRAAVGRADLLRALAVRHRDELALFEDGNIWFGYQFRSDSAPPDISVSPQDPARDAATDTAPAAAKLPLSMRAVHAVVARETRPALPAEPARPRFEPLADDAGTPRAAQRQVHNEDLVPPSRLLPALRRLLATLRPGPLDIAALTRHLATQAPLPQRLPRRRLPAWHADLVVVLDLSLRLWPYHWDFHRLAERLVRLIGQSGVAVRVLERGPAGPWLDHRGLESDAPAAPQPWIMPPAGTPILLVSDFGLLKGESSAVAGAWAEFVAALVLARTRPIGLAPLGAQQLPAALARRLPILRWSPDASMVPARGHDDATPLPNGIEDLLAMIAVTRRVDPPLLRALRQMTPQAPLNAGLEGAVWSHADVEASFFARLRQAPPPLQQDYAGRFSRFDPALQLRLHELRRRHHAHLRAGIEHEETLAWASHAAPQARSAPSVRVAVAQAQSFLGRLAQSVAPAHAASAAGRSAPDWWFVARGIVDRADAAMRDGQEALFHELLAPLLALEGEQARVPEWADPARLRQTQSADIGGRRCWLVEDARTASLRLQTELPVARQRILTSGLEIDGGGLRIRRPGRPAELLRSAASLPVTLDAPEPGAAIEIDTTRDKLVVAPVRRPLGVLGWEVDSDWIEVTAAPLGLWRKTWRGEELSFARRPDAPATWTLRADPQHVPGPSGGAAVAFGIDADFGVFADIGFRTTHGEATQRMRWIAPGSFWMGSPGDEPERDDNEGPRHAVTLTRGVWLADTACTQALWQAVMGENPSHFRGDINLPVEQVSWDDVQRFLRAVEALLPGCAADLPSEAEWEYACRAGTQTPFSFGPTVSPVQVNYDGDYPYAGGAKGEYREKTVPVRSLPPNAWGLFEMHGNVWEWCADGLRDYTEDAQTDPRGPIGNNTDRAVRGGSWDGFAWWARSAYRSAFRPVGSFDYLGFRLCLRSMEQDQSRPGGPSETSPGGRPPRDEAAFFFRGRRKPRA